MAKTETSCGFGGDRDLQPSNERLDWRVYRLNSSQASWCKAAEKLRSVYQIVISTVLVLSSTNGHATEPVYRTLSFREGGEFSVVVRCAFLGETLSLR